MKNSYFGITVFSVLFGITCLIWAVLMSVMAKDLVTKVKGLEKEKSLLEQEKIDLRWQLDQVPYICGGINEE